MLSFFVATVTLITLLVLFFRLYESAPPRLVEASNISQPTPQTPTSTPAYTLTPIPTIFPTKIQAATPTIAQSSANFLLQQVNAYRMSLGLPQVSSNTQTCSFAAIRAREIVSNFNHDGFTSRISNHSLPYPGYQQVTENIALNSNSADVVPKWINSPGHAANMRADTPFVCIVQNGNYFAYEGWRP